MAVAPSLGASAYHREACLAARLPAERMCCQMGTVTKLCGTTGLWMTTARFVVGQRKKKRTVKVKRCPFFFFFFF